MASKTAVLCVLLAALSLAACMPYPGGHGGHHEKYVIHVPLQIDTIHHHSTKIVKVPVYHHHHHHTHHQEHIKYVGDLHHH